MPTGAVFPSGRDTIAAERDFHVQAMTEAIERMKPELMAASEAAHSMKDHDVPGIRDLGRTMELGSLIDGVVGRLVKHIAETLAAFEAGGREGASEPAHRH